MPTQGTDLLATIRTLPANASAAVLLRHAARYPIVDAADPTLAELTPAGMAAATNFGEQLLGFECVRLFHSPVKRCRQTAECIATGLAKTGRATAVEVIGAEDVLGVDYILDLERAGRLSVLHGEHFVRLWFAGQMPAEVIRAAEQIAARKLEYVAQRLDDPGPRGRRLDLHVSHDWNIIVLRELVCGVRHEEAGWLNYLDGIAFCRAKGGLRAFYRDSVATRSLQDMPQ